MLDIFSFTYFLWVIAAVVLFVIVFYGLRNKSEKFQHWFLFSLTVLAWIIHFSRWWLEPNLLIHEMFMKDLCGFSTLVYPFFMLSKNKIFKDYMFFVGGFFALHSLLYPNNIEGDPIWVFNTIRFFFAHFILVSVPLLLVLWKAHIPNIKNLGYMVLFVLIGGIYNMALSAFFVEVGLSDYLINYMGLWGNSDSVYKYAEILAPFLRYTVIENGIEISKPIPFFYMIPALLVFYVPIWILMALPFVKKIKKEKVF